MARFARFRLVPSNKAFRAMLFELDCAYPGKVSVLIGVPARTTNAWFTGELLPSAAGVRVVWLLWALLLHPEQCSTVQDIITWGRFAKPLPARKGPATL